MPTTTNPKSRSTRTKLDKKKEDQIGPEVKVGRERKFSLQTSTFSFPWNYVAQLLVYMLLSCLMLGLTFLSVSLIAGSLSVVSGHDFLDCGA